VVSDFEAVSDFVNKRYNEAKESSEEILFPVEKYSLNESLAGHGGHIRAGAPSITDLPTFKVLRHSKGLSAWAVVLAVDLRRSTFLAMKCGAERMFVLMHTYIPTMAYLVEEAGGKTIGLRGDGLFAGFGITELTGSGNEVTQQVAADALCNSVSSGKAMIECVQELITPLMKEEGIDETLRIGIGIEVGDVVITRIGLESASEVTAYGPAVNRACKLLANKGQNEIYMSNTAYDMFPSSKEGRLKFEQKDGGLLVKHPGDMMMLRGPRVSRPPK
jgi:class 3 adenylate cyclase